MKQNLAVMVRPEEVEIPDDNPFEFDSLDRATGVQVLAHLINSTHGPGVFSVDAHWGNGKTTFLKMLHRFLANTRVPVVWFNAWESDYIADPLTAIVTELSDSLDKFASESDEGVKDKIANALRHAKGLIRTRMPQVVWSLLAKLPIAGSLAEGFSEFFDDSIVDERLEAYKQARDSMNSFKGALNDVTESLSTKEHQVNLVVMIDELDRCRPRYAVELLEVAQHLFSVDGVIFVMAVNRAELAHSVQALYGVHFDAQAYLGRFFDVDFRLPNPDRSGFIDKNLNSAGVSNYLERTRDRDKSLELDTLSSLLKVFLGENIVNLRTAARTIRHLGLIYAMLADDRLVLGTTTATLVILRSLDRDLYYQFVEGQISDADASDSIVELLGCNARNNYRRELATFDAWLIVCQQERDESTNSNSVNPVESPLEQRYEKVNGKDPNIPTGPETQYACKVLELLQAIKCDSGNYEGVKFKAVVERIELLSNDLCAQQRDP